MKLILLLVTLAINNVQAQFSEHCHAKFLSDNQVEYNFKGRQISILGWTHQSQQQRASAVLTLADAIEFANNKDCRSAKKVFEKFAKRFRHKLKESERVILSLEVLYNAKPFQNIGVEFAPEQVTEYVDSSTNEIKDIHMLSQIKSICSDLTKEVDDFYKLEFGPVAFFGKRMSGKVKVKPLETMELKEASARFREAMDFDPGKENLSLKARFLIWRVWKKFNKGEGPTDVEVNAIVDAETNPTMKLKLGRVFKELQQVARIAEKRNEVMIDKVISDAGDYAIVVGQYHVNGLANELERKCRADVSPGSSLSPRRDLDSKVLSVQ